MAATGNQSFGYFGGGWVYESTVDRIDYSNDTATASPKGDLEEVGRTSATGNANFGYWGGGYSGRSWVHRVDYSNDTATALQKGPLAVYAERLQATGNLNFGYLLVVILVLVLPEIQEYNRLDYANDTNTAVSEDQQSTID